MRYRYTRVGNQQQGEKEKSQQNFPPPCMIAPQPQTPQIIYTMRAYTYYVQEVWSNHAMLWILNLGRTDMAMHLGR